MEQKYYICLESDNQTGICMNYPDLPFLCEKKESTKFYSVHQAEGYRARLHGSNRFEIKEY